MISFLKRIFNTTSGNYIHPAKFRTPRIWSNSELAKFSGLFTGDVVNVSGWNDFDKQSNRYKDYVFQLKKLPHIKLHLR